MPSRTAVIAVLGITFALALGSSAWAASLTTPALFAGGPSGQNVCVAINVGTTPVVVTVEVVGLFATDSDTCTLQPNDVDSNCQAFRTNDMAYCRVTAPATKLKFIRAVMMNRSTVSPFTIHATVDAR
jgi:hypothetical protein